MFQSLYCVYEISVTIIFKTIALCSLVAQEFLGGVFEWWEQFKNTPSLFCFLKQKLVGPALSRLRTIERYGSTKLVVSGPALPQSRSIERCRSIELVLPPSRTPTVEDYWELWLHLTLAPAVPHSHKRVCNYGARNPANPLFNSARSLRNEECTFMSFVFDIRSNFRIAPHFFWSRNRLVFIVFDSSKLRKHALSWTLFVDSWKEKGLLLVRI